MLEPAMREALTAHDMLILSGGTSKGAGDVSHRIVYRLGKPGIIAHGVALKPGKPLCLAVCDGKPVVILPGFPTSAMFTFHDMIVPVLRRMAGLPPRADAQVAARIPLRIPSELGRTEFVMVSLVQGAGRARRLSDRQGLRRHHLLCPGRRFHPHRGTGRPSAGRNRGRGDAVYAARPRSRSRRHRQQLHGP